MFCKFHEKRIAIAKCDQCGGGVCSECQVIVKGQNLCDVCATMTQTTRVHTHNVFIAVIFACFLPGFGQVYNGQVGKGVFVFLTFWLVIPWIYGIYDAFVVAVKINRGEIHSDPSMISLSGCLVIFFMLLFGPIIMWKVFKNSIVQYLYAKDQVHAEATMTKVVQAFEVFAKEHGGVYPESYSDLYFADPPYLDELYCDVLIQSYNYTCDFFDNGYKISATPQKDSGEFMFSSHFKSGVFRVISLWPDAALDEKKSFFATTGGKITSGEQK